MMTDVLRAVYILGAFVNLMLAGNTLIYRFMSWLDGDELLGWVQTAVGLLHVVVALLFAVLAQLRARRIPSPATEPRGRHD